jgi:uncharacterized cupredoxin-like copper-binding protein
MSATIDKEPRPSPELDDELRELRAQESALEQRTKWLEVSNPLGIVLSVFALAIAIGALVVALGDRTDTNSMMNGSAPMTASGANRSSGMMSGTAGSGMMGASGGFTSSQIAAAATGTVYVNLGEYWVKPAVSTVRAGKVTFIAKNMGRMPHELMIERAPIKMNAPNEPNEDAAQGMIDDMSSGESGRMTVRLTPGNYVLFCNITGHYAAGQHIPFTVTKS